MAVIAQLGVDADAFDLGRVTGLVDGVTVELERVVPTGGAVMPYFWAQAPDFERFENTVRESDLVESLAVVSRVDDRVLYEVTWTEGVTNLTRTLAASGATVLRGYGSDTWTFELRFVDHADLHAFHDRCRDAGIDFEVERVYSLADESSTALDLGLTADQHDALVVAVERGYFEVPRRATLDDVADALGISQQAASERVRRGANAALSELLFEDASTTGEGDGE